MREKKRWTVKPAIVFGVAGHAAMGIALGVAFALVVTTVPTFGLAELIRHSDAPWTNALTFLGVAVGLFGTGAALTGLILEGSV